MRQDAEAATEDALQTAARDVDSIAIRTGLWSWIFRLTARAAYEALRARRRETGEIAMDDLLSPLAAGGHFVSVVEPGG